MRGAGERKARGAPFPAKSSRRATSTITKTNTFWTQAQTIIPADLTPEQTAEMQRLAVDCYQAVECEGMARVDFLLETATGQFLHQRDQHHSGLHVDQHVSEDVGVLRACRCRSCWTG